MHDTRRHVESLPKSMLNRCSEIVKWGEQVYTLRVISKGYSFYKLQFFCIKKDNNSDLHVSI